MGISTEQSMEDPTSSEATPACEQDSHTDLTQRKNSPKAEVSHRQQDKDQWATCEDLYIIAETLCKMTKMLHHLLTTPEKDNKHIVSQKRSTFDYAQKRICYICRKPGHEARDCRANKTFFNQNQRKAHSQRFNIQQTFNPNLTSSLTKRYQPQQLSKTTTRHESVFPISKQSNISTTGLQLAGISNQRVKLFVRLFSKQVTEQKYNEKADGTVQLQEPESPSTKHKTDWNTGERSKIATPTQGDRILNDFFKWRVSDNTIST